MTPRAYSARVPGSLELRLVRELVREGLAEVKAFSATEPAFSALSTRLLGGARPCADRKRCASFSPPYRDSTECCQTVHLFP